MDRLQSFCMVAQAGGVTKAARGDAARQSLFSRQIKELEEFFGTTLIQRKGRGVIVTPAGQRLNVLARECFSSLIDFKNECHRLPLEVVIGAGESVIQWMLMPKLGDIRKHFLDLRFKFLNLATADAVRRLADGTIDLAIVRKDAVTRPLLAESLGIMGYSLFVPIGLQAAVGSQASLKLLEVLPVATLEGEGSFRRELAQASNQQGLKLNIQIECSSFPLAARAVATGSAAAILPTIAKADLPSSAATAFGFNFLKRLEREMCLASNARVVRIRPVLQQVLIVLAQVCRL